jgi:hypothetical protein
MLLTLEELGGIEAIARWLDGSMDRCDSSER